VRRFPKLLQTALSTELVVGMVAAVGHACKSGSTTALAATAIVSSISRTSRFDSAPCRAWVLLHVS
jgi:hypothetical protein